MLILYLVMVESNMAFKMTASMATITIMDANMATITSSVRE